MGNELKDCQCGCQEQLRRAIARDAACEHEDFEENQDGDRTCRDCGLTMTHAEMFPDSDEAIANSHVSDCRCDVCQRVTARWNSEKGE